VALRGEPARARVAAAGPRDAGGAAGFRARPELHLGATYRRATEEDDPSDHHDDLADGDDADRDDVADFADGHHDERVSHFVADHHDVRTAGGSADLTVASGARTGPVADRVALTGIGVNHRYTGVP
jgi:hypothetical protein